MLHKWPDKNGEGSAAMAEDQKGFWTSMPGILTGLATVLTAITGGPVPGDLGGRAERSGRAGADCAHGSRSREAESRSVLA